MAIGVDNPSKTRERLLEGAGEVFAREGYRGATVREICRVSGCNIAAVNYHFGNKKQLYAAVMKHTCEHAFGGHQPTSAMSPDARPEERLTKVIHTLLLGLFDASRPAWHDRLLAREMLEPTEALAGIILQTIEPVHEQLTSIVGDLLGPGAAADRVRACVNSVFGQCMHLFHSRPMLMRVSPPAAYATANVVRWADHIVRFSLAGIQRVREDEAAA